MQIVVFSGQYREVLKVETANRTLAHRLGCIEAVESGQDLGEVIISSVHLDSPVLQEDDMLSLTSVIQALLEAGRDQRDRTGTA